ncbi:MAG: UDP-N-acetylmuramoyl-L-alanyl-D-glutamate--2,6-diaminopimelate ligase [Bacteriovoracaceae bacterium]|jgi:UDP-N-acetylmuramoyl-L-alanyl-D-glutamate--2,6-diaminopimelate ligase
MNKNKEVLKIINSYGFQSENMDNFLSIERLTTNIQYSNPETGVYYRITSESAEEIFHERLGQVCPAILFLNKALADNIKYPYVVVPDDKAEGFFEELLNELYPLDKSKIKIFGITGTNGKSTSVSLCEQIAMQAGLKAGSLGTVGISLNGEFVELGISGTTPSYIDLRRIIKEVEGKIEFLFMEVSSHAISQKRLGKIKLSGSGWTSFSQDHLDFHNSMEEYFEAKLGIVDYLLENRSLIVPSSDTDLIEKIREGLKKSKKSTKLVIAEDYKDSFKVYPNFFKVHYNRDNLNLSLELLKDFIEIKRIKLEEIKTPKGRFSIIEYNKSFAIIDYAHTPDAILNLVSATKMAFPNSKIVTLFGCGGDRDRTKRPLMAKAAENESDFIIVTSDNPRSEEPERIIKDILPGLEKSNFLIEVDREKAIKIGLSRLGKDDVLIIAGKGHEEYQEVKGQKIFFSDFVVVEEEVKNDSSR